jgi:hypothetical protein
MAEEASAESPDEIVVVRSDSAFSLAIIVLFGFATLKMVQFSRDSVWLHDRLESVDLNAIQKAFLNRFENLFLDGLSSAEPGESVHVVSTIKGIFARAGIAVHTKESIPPHEQHRLLMGGLNLCVHKQINYPWCPSEHPSAGQLANRIHSIRSTDTEDIEFE